MNNLLTVRKFLRLTQSQMAEILSIGQNAYSMIENGHTRLTDRNKSTLADKLHINPNWLDTSEGEMFTRTIEHKTQKHGVPYYAIPINDGHPSSEAANSLTNETNNLKAEYIIDFEPFNDATLYRVVGTTVMSPRYEPGDIIACKKVSNTGIILYGEPYLLKLTIKNTPCEMLRIIRKSANPEKLILRPLNSTFDEIEIDKKALTSLFTIKGKIVQNS